MKFLISILLAFTAMSIGAAEKDEAKPIIDKKTGNADLAVFTVEKAPGTVSAMSLLGISADQTTTVESARNLTVALKAFDGKNAFGLSFTPARTSLVPLDINTYNKSPIGRIWGNTTFSFAQGRATVSGREFDRRALAVETSFYLSPGDDDPLVRYWDALEKAGKTMDKKDPCYIMRSGEPPEKQEDAQPVERQPTPGHPIQTGKPAPMKPDDAASVKERDALAEKCRKQLDADVRWNASKAWLSWATGQYRLSDGGDTNTLGRTLVAGITWGEGAASDKRAWALTLATKRIVDAPIQKNMADPMPKFKSSNLATYRIAFGSDTARAIVEGSNIKNVDPTTSDRSFKRAIGIDLKISDEMWINVRAGRQRRIDNAGDENGSSFSLSYSPKAMLSL